MVALYHLFEIREGWKRVRSLRVAGAVYEKPRRVITQGSCDAPSPCGDMLGFA